MTRMQVAQRTLTLALSQRERGQYPTLPIPDFYRWLAVADASHLATAGGLARLLGGLVRPPRLNDLSPLFYRPPKVPYTSADTTAIALFYPTLLPCKKDVFMLVLNQQPATSNQQPATSNQQPATSNQQPATSNQQPAPSVS
jgi:hypothetical protein